MNQPLTNLAKQLGCSLIALRPHHQQTYRNMHTAADKTVGTMYVHMFADPHVCVHRYVPMHQIMFLFLSFVFEAN